jgi:hypothetical protein
MQDYIESDGYDIQFILKLNEDTSDWVSLVEKPERQAFVSKTNYSIGGIKGLKLGKVVGFLPYDLDEVFEKIELDPEVRHTYDAHLRENMGHKAVYAGDNNNHPYSIDVFRYTVDVGPLMQRRCFDLIGAVGQDTERQCYFNIGKSSRMYENQLPPSVKQNLIMADMVYGYTFYRICEKKTRYVHVFYVDMKLPLGDVIYREIVKKRSKAHHTGYLKALSVKKKEIRNSSMRDVFNDFNKRFVPDNDSKKTWSVLDQDIIK